MKVAAEKLRGFVADHKAQILDIRDNCVTVKIDDAQSGFSNRRSDRPVPFVMELTFEEEKNDGGQRGAAGQQRTLIQVIIRPRRQRDRRRSDMLERARQLLVSVKSYLMAQEHLEAASQPGPDDSRDRFLKKSKTILSQWLSE
jgi:hypothetical protein